MPDLTPIYSADNCSFAGSLRWGLSIFWRNPVADSNWISRLRQALEPDGIRLLSHRLKNDSTSQLSLSTLPNVTPIFLVNRVKGRLQYLVRHDRPKAFQRNYALRSFGPATRTAVERYIAGQVSHHLPADERVEALLQQFQIAQPKVDLSRCRKTAHALYWYNLHVVLVHRERWRNIDEVVLGRVRDMIERVCRLKGLALSRAGILPDHVHPALGCPLEIAPADIMLTFLNNLAYVHGMKAVFQFGAYAGTFGEYHQGAVKNEDVWAEDEEGEVKP